MSLLARLLKEAFWDECQPLYVFFQLLCLLARLLTQVFTFMNLLMFQSSWYYNDEIKSPKTTFRSSVALGCFCVGLKTRML